MTILANHYVLGVHDLAVEAKWFCDVLGFSEEPVDDAGWRFVQRDNCMIMLGHCPDALSPEEMGDHSYFAYLRVDDVESYYRRANELSAKVLEPIKDRPWGLREFALATPGGHRLKVGQLLASTSG